MKIIRLFLVLFVVGNVLAQEPDKRGLGVEKPTPTPNQQTTSQAREAKPELVLQTGYNNIFGATRLVFSPDGRLLATGRRKDVHPAMYALAAVAIGLLVLEHT